MSKLHQQRRGPASLLRLHSLHSWRQLKCFVLWMGHYTDVCDVMGGVLCLVCISQSLLGTGELKHKCPGTAEEF